MHNFPEVFSLKGRTALITGGGTGIGAAIAKSMHAAGATVILVGRRQAELSAAVNELGSRAYAVSHDITQFDKSDSLIELITKEYGPIHCLVNNAGINLKKPAINTSVEEFQTIVSTNVLAAHALTKAVAPQMIERKSGSILFIASMASLFGIPQVVAYSAAKSAQVGMVRTLSAELSSQGIRVNAIAPGGIFNGNDGLFLGAYAKLSPMGRMAEPTEMIEAFKFLLGVGSDYMCGHTLAVDGGWTIW